MSWQITREDLSDLARGATLLGTGGGGDPYIGQMLVENLDRHRPIQVGIPRFEDARHPA